MSHAMRSISALLVCAPLFLAGCSGGGSSDAKDSEGPPVVTETPKITNADDKAMPLDSFLLNPEQSETLMRAQDGIVTDCMKRFGFDYTLPHRTSAGADGDAPTTRISGRFGVQNRKDAEEWGYHKAGGTSAEETASFGGPRLTATMQTALRGVSDLKQKYGSGGQVVNGEKVPDHGCNGEALKRLTGSVDGNMGDAKLAIDLSFDTLTKAQQDKRTRAVFAKWSTCMKGKGFDYADPLAALGDGKWAKSPRPTPQEIQVATADQECRAKHNVVGVWFAVDYAYQEQAVEQNTEALSDVKKNIDGMLKAAATAQAG